jgi:ABC-type transport system involved in cytochrome c biogenesis permease subunit
LRYSSVTVIFAAFVIHSLALLLRMYVQDRPPVTNLYSSAIFCGWGAVCLGLVVERVYRDGLGGFVAALTGFSTLVIAHNLAATSLDGDTLENMRAVLDSNFWLATHVVIVTMGYSAMFVGGFLGICYVLVNLLWRTLLKAPRAWVVGKRLHINRRISAMVYGITAFGLLFSFVGTMLGGIWADQSWGRFWGWDPKENGALMIVLWCALMLHARWGGIVKERGFMLLAIFGNVITAWSWFGVNMLGVGLHAYGFMDAAFVALSLFWLSQFFLIALGLLLPPVPVRAADTTEHART